MLLFITFVTAEEPFRVYAPSPETKQLWVIAARPSPDGITLSVESRVDLDFQGRTITLLTSQPILYVAFVTASQGATITAYKVGNEGSLEKVASIPRDQDIIAR